MQKQKLINPSTNEEAEAGIYTEGVGGDIKFYHLKNSTISKLGYM